MNKLKNQSIPRDAFREPGSRDLDKTLEGARMAARKGDAEGVLERLRDIESRFDSFTAAINSLEAGNAELEESLEDLRKTNQELRSNLRAASAGYDSILSSFHRIHVQCQNIQALRHLRHLPELLAEFKAGFELESVGLMLDQDLFDGFLPTGLHQATNEELVAAGYGLGLVDPEELSYMGPFPSPEILPFSLGCVPSPDGLNQGSCFVGKLLHKFHQRRTIGFITFIDSDPNRYLPNKDTDFLEHFCSVLSCCLVSVLDHAKLDRERVVDPLTGAYNREYLFRHAPRILDFSKRKGFAVSLVFIDLDRFKFINDKFGHKAGDQLLRELVRVISGIVRKYDIFVRLGGDEFVVLLPGMDAEQAAEFRDRVHEAVAEIDLSRCIDEDADLRMTASVGISEFGPGKSLKLLLQEADQKMYDAKRTEYDTIEPMN
ncbi:MAG: diguanylate cyclase [Desulfonatronovibrionaceae bacterium]